MSLTYAPIFKSHFRLKRRLPYYALKIMMANSEEVILKDCLIVNMQRGRTYQLSASSMLRKLTYRVVRGAH